MAHSFLPTVPLNKVIRVLYNDSLEPSPLRVDIAGQVIGVLTLSKKTHAARGFNQIDLAKKSPAKRYRTQGVK